MDLAIDIIDYVTGIGNSSREQYIAIQMWTGHSVSPWQRQFSQALHEPVLVLWLHWGNENTALGWKNTTSNILWRAQLSVVFFSEDKVFWHLLWCLWIYYTVEKLCGTVSRLMWYWLSKKESEGQATECLHRNSHLLKAVLHPLGQKARKVPKSRHFEVVVLLGLEHLRYGWKELVINTDG